MTLIEIQPRIVITQKDVDEIIKHYEKMSTKFKLAMGKFCGNKDDIIKEIKKLSEVGKQFLLTDYRFKEWLAKQGNKK